VRLTWKDGSSTPLVEAPATPVAATVAFWFAAAIQYALEAPGGRRDAVTHVR
jgi:hypothetical protein